MNEFVSNINSCVVIDLGLVHNPSGNITIVQNGLKIPFNIKRIYYLYDVPGGSERGGHAHKELYQIIIAASGSFDVILDDSKSKKTIKLNRPNFGLLVVPGIWRELVNFSSGSVCLVLASINYNEEDYIRDYHLFIKYKK